MLFNPGDRLQYRTFYATVIPSIPMKGYGLKKGPFVTVDWDTDRKKRPCVEYYGTYPSHVFELAQPTQTKEERILKKIAYLDNKWKEQQRDKTYNLSLQHEEQKCTPTIISPSDQTSIPQQSLQTTPNRSSGQLGCRHNPFLAFASTWGAYRA
jgi:hypothetical protein